MRTSNSMLRITATDSSDAGQSPAAQAHRFDRPLRACPLCDSRAIASYDRDLNDVTISRCGNCGLLFMNPQYTDSHLAELYSHYIAEERAEDAPETRHRIESKADDLQLIDRFAQPGRFLSIGCGDGLELELARDRGWQVDGFDVDASTTSRVARRTGAKIYTGDFFSLDLPDETYDCVFMDQVLEHPKNPQWYLVEIQRILKPQGLLFIGCPNIGSLANSGKTLLGKLSLKKRRGSHYATFHHLFYYSPRVLRNILERYFGYEVLAMEGTPLNGPKDGDPRFPRLHNALGHLRTKFPFLESTFRLVCRKTSQGVAPLARCRAA